MTLQEDSADTVKLLFSAFNTERRKCAGEQKRLDGMRSLD